MKKRIFGILIALIVAFSFVGCKEDEDEPEKSLKITGHDMTGFMASIADATTQTVVALGSFTNGVANLYEGTVDITTMTPNVTTNPWKGSGSYFITLTNLGAGYVSYIYKIDSIPTPYNIANKVTTLDWNDFMLVQQMP